MIAVDTNVLLRLYANDHAVQKQAALNMLAGVPAGHVRVSVVVLAELAWALRSVYKQPKRIIAGVMFDLLTREEFTIESRAAVFKALNWFESFKIDFSDCLIAALNTDAGASPVYTFDMDAAAMNAFCLLGTKGLPD